MNCKFINCSLEQLPLQVRGPNRVEKQRKLED